MLLHRYLHSSRRFTVAITCTVITLFHHVEGFPVLVKEAGSSAPMPILPNSASWFDDSATMSTLVTRSADDVVHDTVFIPTIATMGVLVIICIFCAYNLFVNRDTVHSRGANNEGGPIFSSQYAVGHLESGHGNRPSSRISKSTRGSILSGSASAPDSPSVTSDMLGRLQRRREEEFRQLPRHQDPYQQYMYANHHPQYTHRPSVPGSVMNHGEGVQLQPPHSAHFTTAQPPLMKVDPSRKQPWAQQDPQSLEQSHPGRGIPHSPAGQTSSTRVSSDVLSYATPPEARRPPLPNNTSRPQSQNYFSPQHPAGGVPQPSSTQGDIAHSVPANYTPRLPSATNPAQTSSQTTHVQGFSNQPPGYSAGL